LNIIERTVTRPDQPEEEFTGVQDIKTLIGKTWENGNYNIY